MNGKQRMAEQSKQWLCDALINLMTKENFQDISITEIAQTAELSRKTITPAETAGRGTDVKNYF